MTSLLRKKRSSSASQRPIPQSTTASATTAAAQAFLAKKDDEGQLSNAAAAAALRSYTPTPVGDVQTKRMIRRGSTSSVGSNTSNQRQPFSSDHQRRGSSGSMSQRSFRSPSPGRNATPPVPALPSNVPPLPNNAPVVPAKSSKRREDASRSTASPSSNHKSAQSIESSRWASPKVQAPQSSTTTSVPRDTASPTSPRNINFSRPMSPQMGSPPPLARGTMQSPQPAASLGLTPEQYRRLEERREATRLQEMEWIEREQKRNDAQRLAREGAMAKGARPQSSAGPRVATEPSIASQVLARQRQAGPSAGSGARPLSMPVAAAPPATGYRQSSGPNRQSQTETQAAPARPKQPAPPSALDTDMIPPPSNDQIKAFQTRAASLLARPLTDNYTVPSKPLPKAATTNNLSAADVSKQHGRSVSTPVSAPQSKLVDGRGRAPSESPARSAHFSASPLLPVTKHAPPPRSISPVKSALKGASPRNISPAQARDVIAFSDTGSVLSDESSVPGSGKKKKSVRVSFEERPMMVGQAADTTNSPINTVLSPQDERKHGGEEHDFSMGPRPMLPSFGSVRGRKNLVSEETTGVRTDKEEHLRPVRSIRDNAASLRDDMSDDEDSMATQEAPKNADSVVAAPEIAIQPATPNLEEGKRLTPEAAANQAHDLEGALSAETASSAGASQPKTITDEKVVSAPEIAAKPVVPEATRSEDSDSDESDDDRFSDTVQDQSELEDPGDAGYASLDAIMESPATEAQEGERGLSTLLGRFPSDEKPEQEQETIQIANGIRTDEAASSSVTTPPTEDWNQARAYWSSLSEQQKQALEVSHSSKNLIQPPSKTTTSNAMSQQNTSLRSSPRPAAKTLKKSSTSSPSHPKAHPGQESRPTHFRSSMRPSGSMMSSMRDAPERSPSQGNQQRQSRRVQEPPASADAIALAQATAKAMAAKQAERKAARADAQEDGQRGRATQRDQKPHYSMARSMRDGQLQASARIALPTDSSSMRTTTRSSMRQSMDSIPEAKAGGLLGLGKSKAKPSKPKKARGSTSGRRFASRFVDSSDEDSDGGTSGRVGFRSRFADSDDSDDDAPARPMKITLAPVRGIPTTQDQGLRESTELEDSDEEPTKKKHEPALPRSSKDRPGTPPTSAVLSFGKNPNPAGIESSKHAPDPIKEVKELQSSSPQSRQVNGDTAEGKALAAGTLRDEVVGQSKDKRQSFLSFGRKSKSSESQAALTESKWANTPSSPSSPSSRPQTPSRGLAKTLRETPGDREKRNSVLGLRRFSIGSRDSSAPTTPTGGRAGKEDYPFPPPPIPEKFRELGSGEQPPRPSTSDGLGAVQTGPSQETAQGPSRPPLGEARVSTMTDPGLERQSGSQRKGKLTKTPITSRKTGKPKKFQGLRRAFGMND
ncbi:MAG: hypothetical protein Q9162_001985 [Coniocarpon cinnabarinum]